MSKKPTIETETETETETVKSTEDELAASADRGSRLHWVLLFLLFLLLLLLLLLLLFLLLSDVAAKPDRFAGTVEEDD